MILSRQNYTEEFNFRLATINQVLAIDGCINTLSQAVHAEDFYTRMLNSLYGWQLENKNAVKQNAKGIDLIDESARLVVQVTVTCTKAKIVQTLTKQVMKKYAEEGYALKFVFIGGQDRSVKARSYDNKHHVKFDPTNDIILSEDLVKYFMHLDIEEQERVLHIVRQEMGDEFMLSDEVIEGFFNRSKRELGSRYNPELNVPVSEMDYYKPLIDSDSVKDSIASSAAAIAVSVKEAGVEALSKENPVNCDCVNLELALLFLSDLEALACGRDYVTAESVRNALAHANAILYSGDFVRRRIDGASKTEEVVKEILIQADLFDESMYDVRYDLLDQDFIIINGNGGIGKSHFIADLCAKANSSGTPAFLFLGQNFVESESPLRQMARMVDADLSGKAFLDELSRYTSTRSTRAIIAIDALNEGIGRRYWTSHLHALKESIDGYDNLSLIVSVRSPYETDVIPESLAGFLDSNCITLQGFDYYDNAVEVFCSHYHIDAPTIPILEEGLRNPLYLRLLCEAAQAKGSNIFDLRMSFSDAVEVVVANVNRTLARNDRLAFDRRINIVEMALRAIASDESFINSGWIQYEAAFNLVVETVSGRMNRPCDLLGAMCDEDLLRVQGDFGESTLAFAFERVGDFFAAGELLRKAGADSGKPLNGNAKAYLKGRIESGLREGILEALAIMLPERHGVELFECCDEEMYGKIIYCFIESIPWRRTENLSEETRLFVEEYILKDQSASVRFFSRLIDVSFWAGNGLNALYLHELLLEMDPQARDAVWSWTMLRNERIESIIDWVWRNAAAIPHESLELAEILLAWCTAVPSRRIRDMATKALSCCLAVDPSCAMKLMRAFSSCDDDYVIERVIAAIYGAVSNSETNESWVDAAYAAYDFTYGGIETYPNIMIRNYTDCLVCYLVSIGAVDKAGFPDVLHTGNSAWYQKEISNADIDKELNLTERRYGEDSDEAHNLWWIIHSMTTEYGRGTCAYGDFGRYIFGGYVGCWNNQFESDQDLSNLALWEVLKRRYVPDLHCAFDRAVNRYERGQSRRFERLSKKYQWVETFRLLARLIDNYPPYREDRTYDQEYEEYLTKRMEAFSEACAREGGFPLDFHFEPELDPEEHVESVCRVPLKDFEIFNELSAVRDIDPSFICPDASGMASNDEVLAPELSLLNAKLIYGEAELKEAFDQIEHVIRDGRRFFPLSLIVTKKETMPETAEVHLNSNCGFVRSDDAERFIEFYKAEFGLSALSPDPLFVYAHEYCGGFGYRFYEELRNSELCEEERLVTPASYEYVWEPPYDGSLHGGVARLLVPSREFIEFFGLNQLPTGVWVGEGGKTVCINESTEEGYQLLVDSDYLAEFLESKQLVLVQGRYFEISSHEECQRLWLVSFGDGDSNRNDALISKEQYAKTPGLLDQLGP